MEYSIHELAKLTGVSGRTLRYYHEIGLLTPLYTNEAGYRFYGPDQVNLLQQILFYRERGLGLRQIREIIYGKEFDTMQALNDHLSELEAQQKRLEGLIRTVKRTIASMKGEETMNDKEKFEAFKKEAVAGNEQRYGREIREKYGDGDIDASNRKMLNMSEEAYTRFQQLEKEIKEALQNAVRDGLRPDSPEGEKIAAMHKEWLEYTWLSYSPEAHRGVTEMYVADERFRNYYDSEVPGCAAFLKAAVSAWLA